MFSVSYGLCVLRLWFGGLWWFGGCDGYSLVLPGIEGMISLGYVSWVEVGFVVSILN